MGFSSKGFLGPSGFKLRFASARGGVAALPLLPLLLLLLLLLPLLLLLLLLPLLLLPLKNVPLKSWYHTWPWRAVSRARGLRWPVSTPRSRSRTCGKHCEGSSRARVGVASANCIFALPARRAF